MKRILVLVTLITAAAAAGIGAGTHFRPDPEPAGGDTSHPAEPVEAEALEYVKLTNQFVIPLVENGRIQSLVVMSLSLEIRHGQTEAVLAKEPKLRDVFLQILFDHANSGAFTGTFTEGNTLDRLRQSLLNAAQQTLPEMVNDVLITDIGRQDS